MLKILIPVDGSELSLDAVEYALRLVREGLQAEFVLANVQEPASLYEMVVVRDPQALRGVSAGAGAHLLERAEALCQAAGVACELEVASGDPAHTLIEVAERYACDAVVMGARGKGAIRSALLGSVSQEMIDTCPVPVTIVKHVMVDEGGEGEEGQEGQEGAGEFADDVKD